MSMVIPGRYVELRHSFPIVEVQFGCGGIYLFPLTELESEQVGYSVATDGTPLEGEGDGEWRPSWLAIGYETALGDPLIMDTSEPALPIYTAMHGEGPWKAEQISVSLDAFLESLTEFSRISVGRTCPVDLEKNPLDDQSRTAFLMRVSSLNKGQLSTSFWSVLLEG
jgi:hypothetical protein